MTTINLKATMCSGGGHAHVDIRLNGNLRGQVILQPSDVTSAPTDDELRAAVDVLISAYKVGRTNAQVVAALTAEAGIDIIL